MENQGKVHQYQYITKKIDFRYFYYSFILKTDILAILLGFINSNL